MDSPELTNHSTPLLSPDKYTLASHDRWDLLNLVNKFKQLQAETHSKYGYFIEIRKLKKNEAENLSDAVGDETFMPKC